MTYFVNKIKSKSLAILTLSVSVAVSVPVYGQTGERKDKLRLSLEQAVEYASEHNRTIQNASLDVRKAEAAKWQSIAGLLPQVNASFDYSNFFGYEIDLQQFKVAMPPYGQLGVTTSVALNGAMIVGIQLSEISKKMADITFNKTEREIKDQARTLYISALITEETIRLLEESLGSLRKLHTISQRSVDVGAAEQTDADQIKVQVSTMEATVSSTRRSLEMVYNSIRLCLCLEEGTPLLLTDKLSDIYDESGLLETLNQPFDITRNYDYALLQKSADVAKKQIALKGFSSGPTLSVYHQYNYKKYFTSDEAMRMNMTPPNMIGVQLSVPIFTSGKLTASVKEARIAYQEQLNNVEDAELALRLQYSQLVYNLTSAYERYKTQYQNVELSQRVFDNIALKFEQGYSSSLDVTNANTNLVTALSNCVQAMLEMLNAEISLEQLLNK